MKYTALALFAAISVAGCAITPTLEEREQSFQALSLDHFRSGIDFLDDPLTPTINLNTRPGYQDYQFSCRPREDQFLRAMKFRESGNITLQAYVTSDRNSQWLMPTSVTFPHTLSTRKVDRIGSDVSRCTSYGCMTSEEMIFEITPEELDAVISAMEARNERVLDFRIKGQTGVDRDGRFHINELKAFREAVKQKLGAP